MRDMLEDLRSRAGLGPGREGVVLAVLALVVVGGLWAYGRFGGATAAPVALDTGEDAAAAPAAAATAAAPAAPQLLVVHVVGAVRRPGVYRLPAGARAEEAVNAAGGTLGDASLASLNLARVLQDGEQLVVPTKDEAAAGLPPAGAAPAAGGGGASAPAAGAKVDLNAATAAQLDALPGIGPATAEKIVADREANGPFRSVDDLQRVPGIGQKKADGLKDLVVVR